MSSEADVLWRTWPARILLASLVLLLALPAGAGTYASAVTTFNWIDPSSHTKISATSSPYSFINSSGCGTSLPTIDDNITNIIPIGFNFLFGDKVFDSVRINSNGRIQFISSSIPLDNTTCGYGSPVTQLPIPNSGLNYTMRLYGNDLDPTPKRSGYATVCADGVTAANNPCYVSIATIGTTPNRRFVVTWKGVPEWVSSGASGAYDIQIILQENGEFIYQYGVHTAGPAATTAQVGWQISTANYDIPITGYPAQNYAVRFFVPHPMAEYLMEQASWSDSGAVIDTSGSNKHGSPLGGVNTVAGGKICRGANIPSNANTNNIDAIDTGINVSAELGNAGTVAFWYKAKSAWSGTSIKDAQLLDATVVNNQWFFVVRRSNGMVRFVIRDSTGTDRIAETAAISTAANTWRHIAVTWNFNAMITASNNKATVYVDGVQKAQVTFTSSTTSISSQLGTLYVGDNRSSSTGLNGTGYSADAVIDEVRVYNYELSQQGVASLMNLNPGCQDHYAISTPGTGTSCQPIQVTVASHTAAHQNYVNYNPVTLTTSDNLGNWSLIAGHGTLTPGPANSGTAIYQFSAESQVVLGLLHPAGTVTVHATDGYAVDSENVPITITSTGCAPNRFNACHDFSTSQCRAGARLQTRLAGTAFSTDVGALNTTGDLDTGFAGRAVISLIGRATPGSVDSQNCFAPDTGGTYVIDNAATNFVAGKLSVGATIPAAWREARIKIVCDSTYCPPAGLTSCSQDNFAIRPGMVTIPWGWAAPPSATATPTLSAGTTFLLSATTSTAPADYYAGTLFLDITKLTAQITSQDTTIQAGGTVGTLTINPPLIVNESPSTARATYSEVGYLYLGPGALRDDSFTAVDQGSGDCIAYNPLDPTNTDWLAASAVGGKYGCSIGNATTVSFGRFSPYAFDTTVTPACGSFTYSGQPFPLKVIARNLSGGTTTNYTGKFANTLTYQDVNGAAGAFTPTTLPATSFANGVADLTALPSVSFAFTDKLTAPTTLKVRVMKSGGENSMLGNEGTTLLRSGRLRLFNAYGSVSPLSMRVEAQYWSGKSWIKNTDDSCTTTTGATPQVTFSSPDGVTITPNPIVNGEMSLGGLKLERNNSGSTTINTNVPDWLKSVDGNPPSAKATFGVFGTKESRKTIHIRELY